MTPATRLMVARLAELADRGLTYAEAAEAVDATYGYVASFANIHDIPFQGTQRGRPVGSGRGTDSRSHRMADLFKQGHTLEEIGQFFGVTRERVRQILKKDHGLIGKDGGSFLTTSIKKAARANKLDALYQRKYGCSRKQYIAIKEAGGTLRFADLKRNAWRDQFKLDLNLWQWWTLWQESGHWGERGRGGTGYWMFRERADEPLSVDNVRIARGSDAMAFMRHSNPDRFPGRARVLAA